MLVNNIDILNFNATLLSKDIQTAEVIIFDDWLRKSSSPVYLGKQEKYIKIKLQLLIEDINNENSFNNMSNLISKLKKSTLKFEDLSFYYDSTIINKDNVKVRNGVYTLNVELKSGYAYKPEVTELLSRVTSKTINVPGNLLTPAVVEITPSINLINLTITGLGDSFTIKNLTAGQKVIIDGEAGTVIQNGVNKFNDFDGWEFPKLSPGANTITFSQSSCDVTIKYKPRWI